MASRGHCLLKTPILPFIGKKHPQLCAFFAPAVLLTFDEDFAPTHVLISSRACVQQFWCMDVCLSPSGPVPKLFARACGLGLCSRLLFIPAILLFILRGAVVCWS